MIFYFVQMYKASKQYDFWESKFRSNKHEYN